MTFHITLHAKVETLMEGLGLAKGVEEAEGVELYAVSVDNRDQPSLTSSLPSPAQPFQDDPTPAPAPVDEPEPVANDDAPEGGDGDPDKVIALPADLPYLGTLQKTGLTQDEIEDKVRSGKIRKVKGIGPAAVEKLEEYFGVSTEEEEEWTPTPADVPVSKERKEKAIAQSRDPDLAQIRSALAQLGKAKGKGINAVKRVLKGLGIESLSELEEEQYGQAMALVNEEMAG